MEGVNLDVQDMDSDKEGSVISEDEDVGQAGFSSRATSVWDGEDDNRSEMMVSIRVDFVHFRITNLVILSWLQTYFHTCSLFQEATCMVNTGKQIDPFKHEMVESD